MACKYVYNGVEYSAAQIERLINSGEFTGVVEGTGTLPVYHNEDGSVNVRKTVTKYLDEAVRDRKGVRKNAAKGYYYANRKGEGANSYAQALMTVRKINSIFELPTLGSPVKIQTPTGIKYKIPMVEDSLVKLEGAYAREDRLIDHDDLIASGRKTSGLEKYSALTSTYKYQKRDLYKKLNEQYLLKKKLRKEGDIAGVRMVDKKINRLTGKIDQIDQRLENLHSAGSLEALLDFAQEHLEEIEKIMASGPLDTPTIAYVSRIIKLWQKAGDFDLSEGDSHIFFTSAELGSEFLKYGGIDGTGKWRNGFAFYKQRMDEFANQLREEQEERVTEFVHKYTKDTDLTTMDIYKALTDISPIMARVISLAETKDPMLQSVAIAIKHQNAKARMAAYDTNQKIDEHIKRIEPKLKGREPFEIFKQKDKSGNQTGDLVTRYSVEYFEVKQALREKAESTKKKSDWKAYFTWRKNNEIMFDPRILFPTSTGTYSYTAETYTPTEVDAHKQLLKDHMGEQGYDKYMERLEKKLQEFEMEYELAEDRIMADPLMTSDEKDEALELWDKTNSPYWAAARVVDGKVLSTKGGIGIKSLQGQHKSYSIPRRFDYSGKETGWYDKNFEEIAGDSDLLGFYDFMLDTLYELNLLLPQDVKKNIRSNTIPTIKKTILEKFGQDGSGKMAALGLWDQFMEIVRSEDLAEVSTADIDPVTGKEERNVKFNLLSNQKQEFDNRLEVEKAKFTLTNNRPPTRPETKDIEKEVLDEMSRQKSFDLGKILKLYAFTAQSFYHKAAIEDIVKLAEQQFQTRKETHTNAAGIELMLMGGSPATKEGLDNYQEMLDYALKHFYGVRTQEVEMSTKTEVLTSEEKTLKKELESLLQANQESYDSKRITKKIYEQQKADLTRQLEELGGVLTGSGIVNAALKWFQLKGMGWNVLAGIANMGFGFVANTVEAGDGRLFNMSDLRQAWRLTLHSVKKNWTFNNLEDPTARKIRRLMDRFDVLKDASDELYKASTRSILGGSRLKFLDPYQMQKRTEFINQAPVMLAMMLNEKNMVVDKAGNRVPIYEAFDNDGLWKEAEFGPEPIDLILDLKTNIDQGIKKTHGNYDSDSPLLVKASTLGRALIQFRTWMFEGFFNRFGKEYKDYSVGYVRKGRYRSGFGVVGYAQGTELAWWEQSALLTKELTRRMFLGHFIQKMERSGTFLGKDYEFKEEDFANLSANINELIIYGIMTVVIGGLKNMKDDDDERQKRIMNILLNELLRVQTDIVFYSNPSALESLLKRPIPAAAAITDTGQLMAAIGKAMVGDDKISSGVFAGDSRVLRELSQFFPFTTQAHKTYSASIQLFDK